MRIEPKQAFYNEDTGAVQPWKDIEVPDAVGNTLVAEGLVTEIEGGGGGADGVKTAKVTLTANAGEGDEAFASLDGRVQHTLEGSVFLSEHGVSTMGFAAAGNSAELTAILTEVEGAYSATYFVNGSNPVVTGDCELSELDSDIVAIVTGDCTITVDPTE